MRRLLIVGIASAAAALGAAPAHASCAMPDPPAERLARMDAAFAGTVVARSESAIRFRVERALKGDLGPEIEIPNPLTSVQIGLQPGERTGLFLYRDHGALVSNDCLRTGPEDLLAAAVPPPCKGGARVHGRRVVGCGQPPEGRGFRVVDRRIRSSRRHCLAILPLSGGGRPRCGPPPGHRADVYVTGGPGRFVSGAASWDTQGIALRYRLRDGSEAVRRAALVPVKGKRTLRRLGAGGRFVQWAVELPPGAAAVALERHGFGGATTDRIFLGPDAGHPQAPRR